MVLPAGWASLPVLVGGVVVRLAFIVPVGTSLQVLRDLVGSGAHGGPPGAALRHPHGHAGHHRADG